MLWSPANRRTGRSHHPNEEAATGVDHPVNCKGAWNSRAQEATCEASCCAEPVAPRAEQAEVALLIQGMAMAESSSSFQRWDVSKLQEVFHLGNMQEPKDAPLEGTME